MTARSAQSVKVRKDQAGEKLRQKLFIAFCVQNEVQGGVWVRGAHSRGAQQLKDFEKLNAAQLRGWRVFQVTPDQLCTTETLDLLRLTLNRRRTA